MIARLRVWARRALMAAAAGILAGCWHRESNVDRGNREQVLYRGVGPDLADLDPHLANGIVEYNVLSALFEGLVSEDPRDLHPVPGVAESWQVSPDGLTYTFHLRANAKWSNQEPVTAQDFVQSYQRILSPSLRADHASLLYVIQNAQAYHQGKLIDFSQVGVSALSPQSLRIVLEHPTPQFLSMLNQTAYFPVHLPTVAKYGGPFERNNRWTLPGHFVGNGPFSLASWKPGQEIVAIRSLTYWDQAAVRLNGIHFLPIDSRDTEEREFRAGQLHLTEALPPSKIETYRQNHPELLRIDPYLGTEFYRLNVRMPFLNDPRVRRALALAVDRQAIVEKILRGGQKPAVAFTPPGTAGYTPSAHLSTDFPAARRLLAEAGYPGGKGAPPIELTLNKSESHSAVAEAVQEMWRRELGLEVHLVLQEPKVMFASRTRGEFQVLRSVWIGDYDDPLSFLEIWSTGSGNNYTGWENPGYDQFLFKAARTGDAAARRELFDQAENLLLQDCPFVPLYHYTHVFVIRPSVKGWYPTLLDHHPYKAVWLEPDNS